MARQAAEITSLTYALLVELHANGRASVSELARSLGAPAPDVRRALQRLTSTGALKFSVYVDPAYTGRPVVAFFAVSTDGDVESVGRDLANEAAVKWVTHSDDESVRAQVSVADNDALLALVNRIRALPHVSRVESTMLLRGVALPLQPLRGRDSVLRRIDFLGSARVEPLAGIDRILVDALQRNGRASYTELASLAGLSISAARQRFLRLEAAGVFTVRGAPGKDAVDLRACAALEITITTDGSSVVSDLMAVQNMAYVVEVVGGYDIFGEVLCVDEEQLQLRVAEVRALPGVASCVVRRYRKNVKNDSVF